MQNPVSRVLERRQANTLRLHQSMIATRYRKPLAAPSKPGIKHLDRDEVARGATEPGERRSEEHTSELPSLMRISYAVFCLKKKNKHLTLYDEGFFMLQKHQKNKT